MQKSLLIEVPKRHLAKRLVDEHQPFQRIISSIKIGIVPDKNRPSLATLKQPLQLLKLQGLVV